MGLFGTLTPKQREKKAEGAALRRRREREEPWQLLMEEQMGDGGACEPRSTAAGGKVA